MHFDAEFWVALGFVVFLCILAYLGVHSRLATALDERTKRIAAELAEAKRLRDEAAALLGASRRRPPRPKRKLPRSSPRRAGTPRRWPRKRKCE